MSEGEQWSEAPTIKSTGERFDELREALLELQMTNELIRLDELLLALKADVMETEERYAAELREAREHAGALDKNWSNLHEAAMSAMCDELDMPGADVPSMREEVRRLKRFFVVGERVVLSLTGAVGALVQESIPLMRRENARLRERIASTSDVDRAG